MFAPTRHSNAGRGLIRHRQAGRAAGLVLVVVSLTSCASMRYTDLFNPTVTVEVEHPPGVGFVVNEVVFAADSPSLLETLGSLFGLTSGARCEAEFVQALTQLLVEGGIQVVGDDDEERADVVIAVDVTRCDTKQDRTETSREVVETVGDNTRRRIVPEYHARTQVSFRSTFEVTDLSTGLLAVSRSLTYAPEMTYSSVEGHPEFPSPADVVRQAYSSAIEAVIPIFFHWVEARELVFFDDQRCGLNLAYRAVEAGDYERALEISIENAESCQLDPAADITEKDVAATHYNVGLLYRVLGNFDFALVSLDQAHAMDPENDVIGEAIEETLSAEAAAAALSQADEDAAVRGGQLQSEAEEEANRAIRNDDIVSMFRDGLADEVILEVIRTSEVDFDVSPATLGELNREGLSSAVIAAMVAAAGRSEAEIGIGGNSWRES